MRIAVLEREEDARMRRAPGPPAAAPRVPQMVELQRMERRHHVGNEIALQS
jgi:hypothetical protein